MLRLLYILLTVLLLSLASPALAQSIDEAVDLEDQGLLVDALDAFEELLDGRGNSRREMLTILEHLSVLRFASGDSDGARDAAMRLLAISPRATHPESAPPELQEIFEQAADRWEGRGLRARLDGSDDGEMVTVRVRVENDLMDMVAGAELRAGGDMIEEIEGPGPVLELRASSERAEEGILEVTLVNGQGSTLWSDEVEIEPSRRPERRGGDTPRETGARPRWHRVVAGVMLGVGLASVAGGAVALGFNGTTTGETRVVGAVVEEQYRNTAAGGGVLVGLGGAAAIGGLIWLLLSRRSRGGDVQGEAEGDRSW